MSKSFKEHSSRPENKTAFVFVLGLLFNAAAMNMRSKSNENQLNDRENQVDKYQPNTTISNEAKKFTSVWRMYCNRDNSVLLSFQSLLYILIKKTNQHALFICVRHCSVSIEIRTMHIQYIIICS